jgi:hypothetical protein
MSAKCIHCDSLLTHKERQEGWCDSCGKRLPASMKARGAYTSGPRATGPAASAPGSKVATFFVVFALALVFGLFTAVIGAVVTGGKGGHYVGGAGAAVGAGLGRAFMRRRSDQA